VTRRRTIQMALCAAMLSLTAVPASAAATTTASTVTHHTGTLADGATWIADVPSAWNGVLVLYSHGFGTLSPADAPNPATQQVLLDRGYALVGSSYDPNGSLWALASATRDQFASLAAIEDIIGPPRLTLALGTSMGGLISAQEAQNAGHRLDGVVSTCGLVAGGIDLNNYQLDGEYALSHLLAADQHVKLVDYASPAEGALAATQLSAAATTAQATAQGRARVALATALLNMPTWSTQQAEPPGAHDAVGIAKAQYDWLVGTLPFIMPARYFIELAAGGNASWNVGVDYAALIARSPYRDTVRTLYREAGLNLRADLANLTRHAAVRADTGAVVSLSRTSTVTGHLDVPTLNLHTPYDQLAPVEDEDRYAAQVRAAGDTSLLRQAFIARRGHCAFTPSEIVAALQAVTHRVGTGHWDQAATTESLQAAAVAVGLSDAPAFVDFRPGPLVSHREFRPCCHGV
jgi:homoserine acetyltransferase